MPNFFRTETDQETIFDCDQPDCEMSFESLSDLAKHKIDNHPDIEIRCGPCDREYPYTNRHHKEHLRLKMHIDGGKKKLR